MFSILCLVLLLAIQLSTISAAPTKRLATTAAIPADFPDPALIQVQNNWYAFGTTNGKNNIQIARSGDFNAWAVLGKDALPKLPAWASGPVWAPDVAQRVCTWDNAVQNANNL
jgi:beta-xylosidase